MNHPHHKEHTYLKNEMILLGIIGAVVVFIAVMVVFLEDSNQAMFKSLSDSRSYTTEQQVTKTGVKKINGIVIFYEGDSMVQVPSSGMSLPDGIKIEQDGTIQNSDGTKVVLKEGQNFEIK